MSRFRHGRIEADMALTPKQQRFAEEYLIDLNATQAAIRAGYSEKTANQQGPRLLVNVRVTSEIARLQVERSERTKITQDKVLEGLAEIGFANMADYMQVGEDGDPYLDFSKLSRAQTAALQEVTVEDFKDGRGDDARDVRRIKFKLYDRRAALVDIGKHLGMFVDRHLHGNDPDNPLVSFLRGVNGSSRAGPAGAEPVQRLAMAGQQPLLHQD